MYSDTLHSGRTAKLLEEYTEKHRASHIEKGCRKFQATCPFCQIIVEQQSDKAYEIIHALFSMHVARALADTPELADHRANELLGNLAFTAYQDWVQPRYEDIDLTDEELLNHPYVRRKLLE